MSEPTPLPTRKRKTPWSVWITAVVLLAAAAGGGWLVYQRMNPSEAPSAGGPAGPGP